MLGGIMPSGIMLSVTFIFYYSECYCAKCHYVECGYAECHGARYTVRLCRHIPQKGGWDTGVGRSSSI
jgi:hypothetical protein